MKQNLLISLFTLFFLASCNNSNDPQYTFVSPQTLEESKGMLNGKWEEILYYKMGIDTVFVDNQPYILYNPIPIAKPEPECDSFVTTVIFDSNLIAMEYEHWYIENQKTDSVKIEKSKHWDTISYNVISEDMIRTFNRPIRYGSSYFSLDVIHNIDFCSKDSIIITKLIHIIHKNDIGTYKDTSLLRRKIN